MKFPGAPYGLKMACGENPKRVYGGKQPDAADPDGQYRPDPRRPGSRRSEYDRKWDKYDKAGGEIPARDLALDTLRGVLDGKILVHNHCYRADEMAIMIDMAKEFGYKIASFHHAVESLQDRRPAARRTASARRCGPTGTASRWKAYDAINENIPFVHNAGACAIVHSRRRQRHPAAEPGSGQGAGRGRRAGHQHHRRGRLDLARRSTRPRRSASPTRPAA